LLNTATSICLSAPAKLNVFLEVLGKRDDGFHELETIMLRTDLCDVLHFEATSDAQLTLRVANSDSTHVAADFPLDESNLILRAARAMQQATASTLGAAITIDKRIPAEAGLAGGSSNAATTLLGLNQLWNLELPKSELHRLAATLGSDVNFFVEDCRAAVCRGRGEQIEPIPMAGSLSFVVARPPVGNSTPEVFRRLEPACEHRSFRPVADVLSTGRLQNLADVAYNRLTEPAMCLNPGMARLMQQMSDRCSRPVFMSGSGSTCFLIAHTPREARRMLTQLVGLDTAFLAAVRI